MRAPKRKKLASATFGLGCLLVFVLLFGLGPLPAPAVTTAGVAQTPPRVGAKPPAEADLPALLEKAAEYCRKLEGSVLDFICLEAVEETIDYSLEMNAPIVPLPSWTYDGGVRGTQVISSAGRIKKVKNTYLYEYQCIRADRIIKERRTLLKEGRVKRNEPEAKLKTASLTYHNGLMGPLNLFGRAFQPGYDYRIAGREKFEKRPVVVIEAKPRAGVPEPLCLSGKAWLDPGTAEILKVEWTQKPEGERGAFDLRESKYKRKLRLTLRTEFSVEKNGLRFPSRLAIEEAYLNARGRVFVRSSTNVVYSDFKFFTVEVDVR